VIQYKKIMSDLIFISRFSSEVWAFKLFPLYVMQAKLQVLWIASWQDLAPLFHILVQAPMPLKQ